MLALNEKLEVLPCLRKDMRKGGVWIHDSKNKERDIWYYFDPCELGVGGPYRVDPIPILALEL